jgi:hypothetical protein
MADNDKISVRATHSRTQVAIHRIHEDDRRTLVGYYSPDEAEDIGMRIIRAAGMARERAAAKQQTLKSVA